MPVVDIYPQCVRTSGVIRMIHKMLSEGLLWLGAWTDWNINIFDKALRDRFPILS